MEGGAPEGSAGHGRVAARVLPHGATAVFGREAVRSAVAVVQEVADLVRSMYGPRSRDKLICDAHGELTLTNDGATALAKLPLDDPVAQLVVQLSAGQDREAGDGTTGVVLLAAAMLQHAHEALEEGMHARELVRAFRACAAEAHDVVNRVACEPSAALVEAVARTTLSSKVVGAQRAHFARLATRALQPPRRVADVRVMCVEGGALGDSWLHRGVAMEQTFVYAGHDMAPRELDAPRVVLLDMELEHKHAKEFAHVDVRDPQDYAAFARAERALLDTQLAALDACGAMLVVSARSIGDVATQHLARRGAACVGRVPMHVLAAIARCCGARVLTTLHDGVPGDAVGEQCARYEERTLGAQRVLLLHGDTAACPVSTLVLRGGTRDVLDEAARSMDDALAAVACALRDGVVCGGGAVESAVRAALDTRTGHGRAGRARAAWLDALDVIPLTLARNAGSTHARECVSALHARHVAGAGAVSAVWGVDAAVRGAGVTDMLAAGVVEPRRAKAHALRAATELACTLLTLHSRVVLPRAASDTQRVATSARAAQLRTLEQHAARRRAAATRKPLVM